MDVKTYKRNTAIFILLFIAEIVSGYFLNSFAVMADGLLCLSTASISVKAKKTRTPVNVITIIISIALLYFSILKMTTAFDSQVASLWAFPVFAVSTLIKLFIMMSTSDTATVTEDKEMKKYTSSILITIISGVAVIVGVIISYLTTMTYIDSVVSIGITAVSVITAIRMLAQNKKKTEIRYVEDIQSETSAEDSENDN